MYLYYSLFSLENFPEKVHLLNTQYHMNPAILQFTNKALYNNRIITDASVYNCALHVKNPFLFVETKNRLDEKEHFSWNNSFEAMATKSLIQGDEEIINVCKKLHGSRVIIISPYQAQVR